MMHVGRGREHPLHIEYVHIGACLAFIQDTLTEALLSHPRIKMDRKIALIKALGKVIWIQNDLFAKWYVRDGEEFTAEAEKPVFEQEGYLDGRKVLDDIEEGGEGGEGEAVAGDIGDSEKKGKGAQQSEEGEKDDGSTTPRSPKSPTKGPASMTCPFSGIPIRSSKMDDHHAAVGGIPKVKAAEAGEVAGA